MLQTARATVTDIQNKQSSELRILFDSGAQLNYIIPEAKDSLGLKTICVHQVTVKAFSNEAVTKDLEKVRFSVHLCDGVSSITVDAYVSNICFPVEHQAINVAKAEYKHLQHLYLADSNLC